MEQLTPLRYLPEEIILDILFRLPIKSLVRFRSVCKYWRFLFSNDPEFALRYSWIRPSCYVYLLRLTPYEPAYSSSFPLHDILALVQDNQVSHPVKVKPPLPRCPADIAFTATAVGDDVHRYLTVIGSIDGVFCLSYESTHFILWNPATQDWHHALRPKITGDVIYKGLLGFARDGRGSFKVVRIVQKNCSHCWRKGDPYCCAPEMEAEVYDSSNDYWTEMGRPPKGFDLCVNDCCTIVRGVPYWCTFTWSALIISFDPNADKFREFAGPGFSVENKDFSWSLGEISGSLVALMQKRDKGVDVWKMVEGGDLAGQVRWTKQFSIGPMEGVEKWVKCWKSGEFLVASEGDDPHGSATKLRLYDPWTEKTKFLPDFSDGRCSLQEVFVYEESLLSPRNHVHGA